MGTDMSKNNHLRKAEFLQLLPASSAKPEANWDEEEVPSVICRVPGLRAPHDHILLTPELTG